MEEENWHDTGSSSRRLPDDPGPKNPFCSSVRGVKYQMSCVLDSFCVSFSAVLAKGDLCKYLHAVSGSSWRQDVEHLEAEWIPLCDLLTRSYLTGPTGRAGSETVVVFLLLRKTGENAIGSCAPDWGFVLCLPFPACLFFFPLQTFYRRKPR